MQIHSLPTGGTMNSSDIVFPGLPLQTKQHSLNGHFSIYHSEERLTENTT